jgi:hypothetical protein
VVGYGSFSKRRRVAIHRYGGSLVVLLKEAVVKYYEYHSLYGWDKVGVNEM